MKQIRIHFPNLSYVAAFIIGVIPFVSLWKTLFVGTSGVILLAGMGGVVVAVTTYWLRNEFKNPKDKDE